MQVAFHKFKGAKLDAEFLVKPGHPKRVLIEEAEKRGAGCIFAGSSFFINKPERFLISSTSAAVAERAQCSVEIIRVMLK